MKKEPGLHRAYINLSAVYNQMGRYEQAVATGKKGLGSGDTSWEMQANYNIGLSYFQWAAERNDTEDRKGEPYFRKAMELNPSFGGSAYYLGVYKEVLDKNYPAAAGLYKKGCAAGYQQACDFYDKFAERTGISAEEAMRRTK